MRLRMFGKMLATALAGLGLAAAPALAKPVATIAAPTVAAPAPAAAPRPAIWLLEDQDTKIYLFGTVHIFERGFAWRSPGLERIIAEADELVTETGDDRDPAAAAADAHSFADMFMAEPVPILDRVSPDRRKTLARLIEESGLPSEMWDEMHSYAAAMMLIAIQLQRSGQDESNMSGAEIELYEAFRARGAPISGVESNAQQAEILRTMSPEAQRAFLDSTVDSAAVSYEESGLAGDEDWARGNLEGIERDLASMPPDLYEPLLSNRNRAWAEWLQRRLERPGTVLFAVGVGHLVGRDSVQTLLAARGLRVTRVE